MKKKVYYKLNRYKVAKVEVESVEQEQAVKILNRETDRFAKSEDTYYEKCSSLDEMYEETGFEPADDTPSPEEQMIRASEQNELKVRICSLFNERAAALQDGKSDVDSLVKGFYQDTPDYLVNEEIRMLKDVGR